MASEAQRKARDKYNAQRKNITLNFAPTEIDLYNHVTAQPDKMQTYIKNLIRADMERGGEDAVD